MDHFALYWPASSVLTSRLCGGVDFHDDDPEALVSANPRLTNSCTKSFHAMPVCKKIEEREEDREGLLHAHETMEWPFTVKLYNGLHHRRISRFSFISDDMLTGVIAFLWACPE